MLHAERNEAEYKFRPERFTWSMAVKGEVNTESSPVHDRLDKEGEEEA